MKNKKRTLLLSLSCALAFVIALCGFNAYADITSDNNNSGTMVYADGTLTSGSDSVVIEQIEQERVDATKLPTADNLKDFSQKKPLYPALSPTLAIRVLYHSIHLGSLKIYCRH